MREALERWAALPSSVLVESLHPTPLHLAGVASSDPTAILWVMCINQVGCDEALGSCRGCGQPGCNPSPPPAVQQLLLTTVPLHVSEMRELSVASSSSLLKRSWIQISLCYPQSFNIAS